MVVAGRLTYIMIFRGEYYSERATSLHERERSIKAPRGRIYDRNGNVLADNKAVCSVSVIHSQIEDEDEVIDLLMGYIDKDSAEIEKKVRKNSSRELIASNVDKICRRFQIRIWRRSRNKHEQDPRKGSRRT